MKTITLYWSNICVLHKFEHNHLEKIREELLKENIDLRVEYFGIGYPRRMSEALLDESTPLPDMIVSTDLEVFENKEIYGRYCESLIDVCDYFSLKDRENYAQLYTDKRLLPFIAIPMMLYTRDSSYEGASLKDILERKVAFGGVNNSAVKCIYKYIWSKFGRDVAGDFLRNANVYDMPIQSMNAVKTGQADLALTPSIYALRADMEHEFAYPLSDGTIVLPSFAAARNSLDADLAVRILSMILTEDFCNFYVTSGDLVSAIEGTMENRFPALADSMYKYPKGEWFDSITPVEFYKDYCSILPGAIDYSVAV
ncbi:MAG: hypothetical protein E7241_02805 [Lachnospiraceae bacterium]|nr:hypothetical protein [Lachnospiraceae bacterium]